MDVWLGCLGLGYVLGVDLDVIVGGVVYVGDCVCGWCVCGLCIGVVLELCKLFDWRIFDVVCGVVWFGDGVGVDCGLWWFWWFLWEFLVYCCWVCGFYVVVYGVFGCSCGGRLEFEDIGGGCC